MSSSRFAAVRARARGSDAPPTNETGGKTGGDDPNDELPDDEKDESDCKKKEPDMTEKSNAADASVIRAEERARIKAVFASEDVKGREMAAVELLAESDMSAEKIVAMLPKLSPAAAASDDDAVGRLMLEKMGGEVRELGSDGEPRTESSVTAEQIKGGWAKATEFANGMNGHTS